jgi:hypothetical protein
MKKIFGFEKIVRTRHYERGLSKIGHKGLDRDELGQEIEDIIEENPLVGVIIPGTHGVRKFRYAMPGKGKRGGFRVVYYFYNDEGPIFLLDIFAKNDREDITPQDKVMFAEFVKELKKIL